MSDYPALLHGAEAVARRAAAILVSMREGELNVSRKDGLDVVTEADLASERVVIEGLRLLTPNAAILSEEAGAIGSQTGERWIVDPLDGTVNFAAGLPWFSVTMAYQEHGETRLGLTLAPAVGFFASYAAGAGALIDGQRPRVSSTRGLSDAVISVMLTSHFSAEEVEQTVGIIRRLGRFARGVRVIVSGALELSLVASGRMDAFVSIKADAVSHAAGMAFVHAAGGRITQLDGSGTNVENWQKIASNGHIHDELLSCLKD
jgi:myo-inositol-1(or 4)-monophosphatase